MPGSVVGGVTHVNDLGGQLTISVKVTRQFFVRLRVGLLLLRIAAWVLNAHVEVDDD